MRCNPWRWLWGLLPLAVLALIVNFLERSRIEADLTNRTKEAIAKAGMDWAAINFTKGGRDGLISGDAVDEQDRDKIHDVASSVWGVRTIDNKAKLLDKVDKYAWNLTVHDKEVRIKGLAPSETDRKAIVKMAEASFPGFQIKHDMKLARGVPDKQAWLAGIDYSMKQLRQLARGQADIDNLALSLSGDAATPATYKAVKTALASLPRNVTLKQERITPPAVKPFVWSARLDGKQVVLSGYAPSEKARDQAMQSAAQRFGGRGVADRMEIGSGAPKDWERATDVALTQLAKLEAGEARLSDIDFHIEGMAEEEATRDVVATALKTALPQAFRGTEKISFRTPKITVVSPFLTRAVMSGDQVVLLGYVPSEEARQAIVTFAKGQFPGQRVADRMNVANGAADSWQACTQAGLQALRALGNGHFELKDKTYVFSGATKDEGLARAVPADLTGHAGAACTGKATIELTKVEAPPAPAPVASAPMASAPAAAPRPVAATPPPAGPVVSRDDCQKLLNETVRTGVILFERARADIHAESHPTLDRLAQIANRCPKVSIEIGGHTDARGSAALNQRLSEQRAEAVAAYLARLGVDEGRLFPIGYGPSRPVAPNDTDEDRAKNRRIEFTVRPG